MCYRKLCPVFWGEIKRRKKGEFVSLSSSDSSIIIRIFRWTNDQRFGLESLTKKCIMIKKLNFLKFFFGFYILDFFFILPPPVGIPLAMSLSTSFLSSIETFSWNCIFNNYASLKKLQRAKKITWKYTLFICHKWQSLFLNTLRIFFCNQKKKMFQFWSFSGKFE